MNNISSSGTALLQKLLNVWLVFLGDSKTEFEIKRAISNLQSVLVFAL